MPRARRKKCLVDWCSGEEPFKLLIRVPDCPVRRRSWFEAIGKNFTTSTNAYVCEDHFVLEQDAENWMEFKMIKTRLRIKKDVVPHIFSENLQTPQITDKTRRDENLSSPKRWNAVNSAVRSREVSPTILLSISQNSDEKVEFNGETAFTPHLVGAPISNDGLGEVGSGSEVLIKQEPEEHMANYDFPVVIVKEEPVWNETDAENPLDEEHSGDHQSQIDCSLNQSNTWQQEAPTDNATTYTENLSGNAETTGSFVIDVDGSSEDSVQSPPSSPPTPDDDRGADPDYEDEDDILNDYEDEISYDEELDEKPEYISDRIYICHWCSQKFTLRRWLKCHLYEKHSGEKPYACNKCDYRAKSRWILRDHNYSKHSLKKRFICDVCHQRYVTKGSLWNHKAHVHRKNKFKCDTCGFETNYKEKLKMHTMRHTGEKPRVCEICKARFLYPSALKTHKLIHTGEKPFACDRCDYRCRQSGMLTSHKRVHHPEGS